MRNRRIERLRNVMRELELDAFLISSPPNVRYLSGFSGSNTLCIIRPRNAALVTDPRYLRQVRLEAPGWRRVITPLGLLEGTRRRGLLAGCRRVGFESQHATYAQYRTMRRLFPGVSFRPEMDVVETLEMVKGRKELEAISRAAAISDRAFLATLPMIRVGAREIDIAAEISWQQRRGGGERDAFDTIVASGVRTVLPHATPTNRRLRRGDLVTMDFGCTIGGYSCDVTRTVVIGKASRRARAVYDTVFAAQEEAIAAARGGMMARDLDAVARKRITAGGYGKYFVHSLGHGLGLHIHERPRISLLSNDRLLAGSVIAIEPGVYIPGFGGVRIEDDVVLTETGCRVLTHSPKEFMVL